MRGGEGRRGKEEEEEEEGRKSLDKTKNEPREWDTADCELLREPRKV
jgi:hypothetical protein